MDSMAIELIVCMVLLTSVRSEKYDSTYKFNDVINRKEYNRNYTKNETVYNTSQNMLDTSRLEYIINLSNVKKSEVNETVKNINTKQILKTDNAKLIEREPPNTITDKEQITMTSSVVQRYYNIPQYEVHENIIDIPDDRTPAGPIITNYTKRPHFNTIRPINNIAPKTTSTIKIKNNNVKNILNLLNIKKKNGDADGTNDDLKCFKLNCLFNGIKDYLHSIQKDFVNGIHNLFDESEITDGRRGSSGAYEGRDNRHVYGK